MEAAHAELVTQHLGLARWHARRRAAKIKAKSAEPLLDELTSAAYEGLVLAARDFDPEAGANFSTYASIRIQGAMSDFMRSRRRGYQVRNGIGRDYDGSFPRTDFLPHVGRLQALRGSGQNSHESGNDDRWAMVASRDPGPEDVAIENVRLAQLVAALRKAATGWTQRQRDWLEDVVIEGMTLRASAERRGIDEGYVSVLGSSLRPRLRALLAAWDRVA